MLFAGSSNSELAQEIARNINIPLSRSTVTKFADGELKIKIEENIRGQDVFIIQSTNPPAENLLELLLFLDAAKRASAERITAVIPYYGYARQDRKDEPRVPISAKLIADLLAVSGAGRVLTIDLHAEQIQGFFNIPVDHLYAVPVFIDYYNEKKIENYVVVSPDAGRVNRVRAFARRMGKDIPIAIIDKRRTGPNQSNVINVIGDVKGKNAIIYDDMIDTGGTIVDAAMALADKGVREIFVCAVHGLFSRNAIEKIEKSPIREVAITNTIKIAREKMVDKLKILSIAYLLAEAIKRIHNNESISSLFKEVAE
jgi:ribose-phosphate pyrophosphokinase|uniref:Ribose-phosphate pyrophosphokinase n=1 Tax=candidate division WOR-3 bacterium TaxID=2052148 RepID=A0A7C6EK27_UNCW3